jgi:Protein of unknown function (DUF2568)
VPVTLHWINETIAFLLEVAALAALGWWGAKTGTGLALSVALAVGAPLLVAIVWGLFAAPKARIRLPMAGVLAVKTLVFGCAAAAVYALGWRVLAGTFAAAAFVNTAMATFDRRAAMR